MAALENWRVNKSALECNKYMLDHGIAADVTFEVCNRVYDQIRGKTEEECNKTTTIQAHKYQLICRSPVFDAMFCGGLAEKDDVIVDDIDPEAFRQMLNYIYTDKLAMKPDVVMSVLYTSRKYMLSGLTQLCEDYLEKELSGPNNACIFYDHGLLFEEKEWSEMALFVIRMDTKACLEAASFMAIRHSTLSKILDSNRFTTPEVNVFIACEKWANHQLQESGEKATGEAKRQVLGDCVAKIRYPTMSTEDLGTDVVPKRILLAEEELGLFRYLSNKEKRVPPPSEFQAENRHLMGPFTLEYEGACEEFPTTELTTTFEIACNSNISVSEFLVGNTKPGITQTSKSRNIEDTFKINYVTLDGQSINTSFQVDKPCKLSLTEPIQLKRNSKHKVEIKLKNWSNWRGTQIKAPTVLCAATKENNETKEIKECSITDKTTGLHITMTSDNYMFLLGFVYDVI